MIADATLANGLATKVTTNHVFSVYLVQFAPRDVVYAAAKYYHQGDLSDVREIRVVHAKSWDVTIAELLRAIDIAQNGVA